jgi:tRNA dimethylallyltransferase
MNSPAATLPPAILLVGPTASGKTALALEIAARFPCEIISVDSAQVFRDMNVGTAKPDTEILCSVPHHLIDLISPEERYSAARFRADALAAMTDIQRRGKIPLLTGGTLLYVKALREGLADLPAADPAIRAVIDVEAAAKGWPALHAELMVCDPTTATRLAPNDSQRIQRALEIFRQSGRAMSAWVSESPQTVALPYRILGLALVPGERKVLHERIAQRFDAMLAQGLVTEVAALRERYTLHTDMPSMRCVGYRQAWQHLDGELTRDELRDRGIFATRQLAKRQLTWLRSMPDLEFSDCLDLQTPHRLLVRVANFLAA